jgi:hypothetical protein
MLSSQQIPGTAVTTKTVCPNSAVRATHQCNSIHNFNRTSLCPTLSETHQDHSSLRQVVAVAPPPASQLLAAPSSGVSQYRERNQDAASRNGEPQGTSVVAFHIIIILLVATTLRNICLAVRLFSEGRFHRCGTVESSTCRSTCDGSSTGGQLRSK